jgi:hypothetical protein
MNNAEKSDLEHIQYITVKQAAADRSLCFTEAMLRYYLLHAHKNGLCKAVRRIGKKLVLRRDLLLEWIEDHSM